MFHVPIKLLHALVSLQDQDVCQSVLHPAERQKNSDFNRYEDYLSVKKFLQEI